MMNTATFVNASREQRAMILAQAEARLSDQLRFAEAADTRASIYTGIGAALASAGVGLFAASLEKTNLPMALGGIVAAIGFSIAARKAMQSAKAHEFHASGYRPSDFLTDIQDQKPLALTQAEIATDYDTRLAFNSQVLRKRGKLADEAMDQMWLVPAWTAIAVAIGWAISLEPHVAKFLASIG
jgi:hypothetical protein